MTPIHDRIIVKPAKQQAYVSDAGLHLTDDSPDSIGTVVSVGDVIDIALNDVVIFSPLSGTRLDYEGESYLVLKEEDILAIWESTHEQH